MVSDEYPNLKKLYIKETIIVLPQLFLAILYPPQQNLVILFCYLEMPTSR